MEFHLQAKGHVEFAWAMTGILVGTVEVQGDSSPADLRQELEDRAKASALCLRLVLEGVHEVHEAATETPQEEIEARLDAGCLLEGALKHLRQLDSLLDCAKRRALADRLPCRVLALRQEPPGLPGIESLVEFLFKNRYELTWDAGDIYSLTRGVLASGQPGWSRSWSGCNRVFGMHLHDDALEGGSYHEYGTALHHATLLGLTSVCKGLLDDPAFTQADAHVFSEDTGRPYCTALHAALFSKFRYNAINTDIVKMLLHHSRFTAVNDENDWGHLAFHIVASWSNHGSEKTDMVKEFLAADLVDVNALACGGCTVLHMAAGAGDAATCKLLLDHAAFTAADASGTPSASVWGSSPADRDRDDDHLYRDFSWQDVKGTALHTAVETNHADVVAVLLGHSRFTAVTQVNSNGKTALHRAAMLGRLSLVKQLLEDGRSVDVRTRAGETALDLALRLRPAERARSHRSATLSDHEHEDMLRSHDAVITALHHGLKLDIPTLSLQRKQAYEQAHQFEAEDYMDGRWRKRLTLRKESRRKEEAARKAREEELEKLTGKATGHVKKCKESKASKTRSSWSIESPDFQVNLPTQRPRPHDDQWAPG
ncbi:anks1b [Symbiodinium natans]|uniref:Anks1b protein n=1 Tax=Symbiodinium natans TaxID=878477 RepID=A0A812TYX1_9DINO|nr:anks1b [Symbiodinium natans]